MLHRLPNGTWVNPANVSGISPKPDREIGGYTIGCEVTVIHNGAHISLPFEAFGDAQAYADELAAVVNAARAEPQSDRIRGYHALEDQRPENQRS